MEPDPSILLSYNSHMDNHIDEKDEKFALFSTFVRLGILIWSGGILTLTYVTIPNLPQQKIDPTFIASVFIGTAATFGVEAAKKGGGNQCCNKKQ